VRRRLPPALQDRDFALLWASFLTMGFPAQMMAVAVGWQVYAIRRNPLDLGLIGLAEFASRCRRVSSPIDSRDV
jgi:hypothetical protein